MASEPAATDRDLWVVYDGLCPFCTRFATLYRIRQRGAKVHLVDARSGGPVVAEAKAQGLSLEKGVAVKWQGQLYHGNAAMQVLARLGSEDDAFNRLNRAVFSTPGLGRVLYPMMVAGRRLTLKAMGRPPIDD